MTSAEFFASSEAFRKWLAQHHATADELIVGFHKKHTGLPSMTWSDSVDEALCVGWIDGIRHRIDDDRYTIRFTPRRPSSHWSAVNIKKIQMLLDEGRLQPAGRAAWERRRDDKSAQASYERSLALEPAMLKAFQSDPAAWADWQRRPPGYRRLATGWVMSAKRDATRAGRFETLKNRCARGELIPPMTPGKAEPAARRRASKKKPSKKTPSKKTPSKKTPSKKTPSKKTPSKKTPSKKTPSKKTPSKKTPSKKKPSKKKPSKKKPSKKKPSKKKPSKKTPSKTKPAAKRAR